MPCQRGKLFKVEFVKSEGITHWTIKRVLFRKHVLRPSDYQEATKLVSIPIPHVKKSQKQLKLEELVKPKMLRDKLMFEESSSNNFHIN